MNFNGRNNFLQHKELVSREMHVSLLKIKNPCKETAMHTNISNATTYFEN